MVLASVYKPRGTPSILESFFVDEIGRVLDWYLVVFFREVMDPYRVFEGFTFMVPEKKASLPP